MTTIVNRIAIALILALAVLLSPVASQAQQNLLVQTTLSAAVSAPASQTITAPVPYSQVQIASVTGLVGYQLNQTGTINVQSLWVLYVDREEMAVVAVNGLTVQVIRGYNSTVATSHASGQMVLYGKAAWFYNNDPGTTFSQGGGAGVPGGTTCVVAAQFAFPWVNVRTGSEWGCSPTSLTYVPWFNNSSNPNMSVDYGTAAAAAGTQTVLGPLFRLSGTNAITGFAIPVGCNATAVGGCQFTIIPSGAFTWTAAGNIAIVGTAVVGVAITFIWDAGTSKFYPTYNLTTV